jgi:hypothetical protein
MKFLEAFKFLQFVALFHGASAIGYLKEKHDELASKVALLIENQSFTKCQGTTIILDRKNTEQNDFLEECLKILFRKSSSDVELRGFEDSPHKSCLVFIVETSKNFWLAFKTQENV